MEDKVCPSCQKTQCWDEDKGFVNQLCPDFCTLKFNELMVSNMSKCWTDVDDRLPENHQRVLFFAINSKGERSLFIGHFEHGNWMHDWIFDATMYVSKDVAITHWMPIPHFPD